MGKGLQIMKPSVARSVINAENDLFAKMKSSLWSRVQARQCQMLAFCHCWYAGRSESVVPLEGDRKLHNLCLRAKSSACPVSLHASDTESAVRLFTVGAKRGNGFRRP